MHRWRPNSTKYHRGPGEHNGESNGKKHGKWSISRGATEQQLAFARHGYKVVAVPAESRVGTSVIGARQLSPKGGELLKSPLMIRV